MAIRNRLAVLNLALLAAALTPLAAEDHLKFGGPACSTPVLDKKFFIVCHDPDRKIPAWVGYALTSADLTSDNANRKNMDFKPDPDLPRGKRAELADYAQTPANRYDKGHMAPAADFVRSMEAMRATFILSNAVPQKHGINGGLWSKLEDAVRSLAKNRGSVWVFSGPFFAGGKPAKLIGAGKVAVPTHTYKVILSVGADGAGAMFAYLMPNIDKPAGKMANYALSVSKVEQLTGLDFFSALPTNDQARLEQMANPLPEP